tara:strand:+ start:111729 stop:111932 length:204 start_codon:yes stop_codon:yes gene_type:complete
MESIENNLKLCVKSLKSKFENNPTIKAYEKTNNEFEALVERGIAMRRGNNLNTTAESHTAQPVLFNT